MIRITIQQGEKETKFAFNDERLEYAFNFAQDALETGDIGTVITITQED